jgi:hypothetical protein
MLITESGVKLPFDFWNWIERVEKIASIAGAIGTIVIPILILKYEYSAKKRDAQIQTSALERQRQLEQKASEETRARAVAREIEDSANKKFTIAASVLPTLLDSNPRNQIIGADIILAQKPLPESICITLGHVLYDINKNIPEKLDQILAACPSASLIALRSNNESRGPGRGTDEGGRLAAKALNSLTSEQITAASSRPTQTFAAGANVPIQDLRYNVFVISYPTARQANDFIRVRRDEFLRMGLPAKCFAAVNGGSFGVTVARSVSLLEAKKALDILRRNQDTLAGGNFYDGFIHGAAPNARDDVPEFCSDK